MSTAKGLLQRCCSEPALLALLTGLLAALLLGIAPLGPDFAAHAYQRMLFLRHGFELWNNYWYAGRYSFVTYSLIYYPLAGFAGIVPLAAISAALGSWAFATLVQQRWGEAARWAARAFAVVWAFTVLAGAFPFLLGAAFALLALCSLRDRHWQFALWTVLCLAASPLAFLFLAIVVAAVGLSVRPSLRSALFPTVTLASLVLGELVLWRLFPDSGRFPYPASAFVAACVFCAIGAVLTVTVPAARPLYALFLVYLGAAALTFLIPSSIGSNIVRVRYAAIPIALLVLSLRGWRPRSIAVLVLFLAVSWNLTPLASSVAGGWRDPTSAAAFWRPTVAFLKRHTGPGYRVEVVDTRSHWGAVYLPEAGMPVARGWFRQDDFPLNRVLYGKVSARAYVQWLRRLAVRYVVLPNGPLDYSARAEARLLRSGRSGLRVAWQARETTIYAVRRPVPIATGPHAAVVTALTQTGVRLQLAGAGSYRIAIRASPYWHTSRGCLRARSDEMLQLDVAAPGAVTIRFEVTPSAIVRALEGESARCRI